MQMLFFQYIAIGYIILMFYSNIYVVLKRNPAYLTKENKFAMKIPI